MCGENLNEITDINPIPGSPPHVRGKPMLKMQSRKLIGITPACAGKTLTCFFCIVYRGGSPPHVRGKPMLVIGCGHPIRITPACAGKTQLSYLSVQGLQDHPRMCGENKSHLGMRKLCVGSPPHVRGKPRVTQFNLDRAGITPACAGKTPSNDLAAVSWRDHPRMCGENE